MNRNLYGIMIKYPEPGCVKTRLARTVGNEKAAEISRRLTEQIMNTTEPRKAAYERVVFFDPPERLHDFEQWLCGNHLILQQGIDVGERMDNAIKELLDRGAEKAVLTGADIPALNSAIISEAFAALDHTDIVIGPAADGGYYLVGMKAPHGEIFRGIPWSSPEVYSETVRMIRMLELSYRCITMLSDMDTADDYHAYLTQAARPKPETCA